MSEVIAKWDLRFLRLAKEVASWSKDPSTKCGAILVDTNRHIIATGYNGFAVGIYDDPALYEDREEKYKRVIHAELNAILQAKCDLAYSSLYVWPDMPCINCTKHLIQADVQYITYPLFEGKHLMEERWGQDFKVSEELFNEAGVFMEGIEWPDAST